MLKVAIVGNIASGKSTVENFIKNKGYQVYDTDKIAHEILEDNQEIQDCFGTNDRKELAKIVFSDSSKLKKLESIIHPKVKERLLEIFKKDEKIIFVSVPQLFEAEFDSMFDIIIYVFADKNIRLERLMKRNALTIDEAQQRIAAQNEEGKKEKSDFVITNNSSLIELEKQVLTILESINKIDA